MGRERAGCLRQSVLSFDQMNLTSAAREGALFAAGLLLGAANTVRHNRQGYVDPRPFSPDDVDRTIQHAVEIVDLLTECGKVDWSGLRVLEIGPGSDLTTGAVIMSRGAAAYHAVDLFDNRWQAAEGVYDRLNQTIGASVRPGDLRFTQTSFPALPDLTGTFDVIVSNACLEHVAAVPSLLRRLRDFAGPGCQMVHHIDGQTHMRWFRDHDPLNILRYPDSIYRRALDFPGAPNRLRASDYQRFALGAGWPGEIVVGRRAPDGYVSRTRVARRFRSYDDLDVLTFTLVAAVAGGE
jgi:Methyltransferase domain